MLSVMYDANEGFLEGYIKQCPSAVLSYSLQSFVLQSQYPLYQVETLVSHFQRHYAIHQG